MRQSEVVVVVDVVAASIAADVVVALVVVVDACDVGDSALATTPVARLQRSALPSRHLLSLGVVVGVVAPDVAAVAVVVVGGVVVVVVVVAADVVVVAAASGVSIDAVVVVATAAPYLASRPASGPNSCYCISSCASRSLRPYDPFPKHNFALPY
jgi:hypothetical protein